MAFVAVDFETYYDAEITADIFGSVMCARNPQAIPYLVSIYSEELGIDYCGDPLKAPWKKISRHEWVSHYAYFDEAIFRELGVLKKGPKVWHDTFDLAGYLSYPRSLKNFAKTSLGIDMNKTIRDEMKGVIFRELAEEKQKEVIEYARRDAQICYALWMKHRAEWPENEQLVSRINRQAGLEGVRVDVPKIKKAVRYLSELKQGIVNSFPWVQRGQKPLSKRAIDMTCVEAGIVPPPSLSEKDEAFEEWIEENLDKAPWMKSVANYRRCNRFLRLCESMMTRTSAGSHTMYFSIKYYGADSTGRFSGESGFNMQNPPKFVFPSVDLISDDELEKANGIRVDLRGLLIARPKHKFIIADFSQIEPRVLAWLCGDEAMLNNVRESMALYEAHARSTMGWTGGILKKENPKLYGLAKARILGLGYGCGPDKFITVAHVMAGLELSSEESEKNVRAYREQNPKIVSLWKTLSEQAEHAWQSAQFGGSRLFEIELPSGRTLKYFDLRKERNTEGDRKGWQLKARRVIGGYHTKIYGGKLCENLVQATARDILAEALLSLYREGFKVIFHVHDEVIIEVPEDFDDLERVKKILCREPAWIEGLPLDVEMEVATFYKK